MAGGVAQETPQTTPDLGLGSHGVTVALGDASPSEHARGRA